MMAGVKLVHVPYTGNPYSDLIAGQVQMMFSPIPASIAYVRSKQLRPLAVGTPTRLQICQICRRSPKPCRVTTPAAGTHSLRQRECRQMSCAYQQNRRGESRGSRLQEKTCRPGQPPDADDIDRIRQIRRRRHRQMGEGDQVCEHQGRLNAAPAAYQRRPPSATAAGCAVPIAWFTRGMTSVAMSSMERRASPGSSQSIPA